MKMSAPTPCIDAETLAMFAEGTLGEDERARVVAHLSACPDCSELVAEVVKTIDELDEPSSIAEQRATAAAEPVPIRAVAGRRRRVAMAGGILAIAASALFFVFNREPRLDRLIDAVGNQRLTIARPAGDFHYGPIRSAVRGSADDNLALRAEVARLRAAAERTNEARDVHAAGVAQLLAGDVEASIALLERAAQARGDDAAVQSDLGAAYLTRFIEVGDPAAAAAARAAIDTALRLAPSDPTARFNDALLLEHTNQRAAALAAWNRYLELSDDRGWREEGMRHRDALQRAGGGG